MILLNKMLIELKEEEFVRVPIKSLDGVKCMVNFRLIKGCMFDVDIVYRYGNKNEEGHQRIRHKIKDKEISIFGLKEAINEINNIKFSKKTMNLYLKSKHMKSYLQAIIMNHSMKTVLFVLKRLFVKQVVIIVSVYLVI